MKVPAEEIWFSFSRSGGPGGQNVNKVSSKVTLHWIIDESLAFSATQKRIISEFPRIKVLIDDSGVLKLSSQQTRSQNENRKIAHEKLNQLIRLALTPKKVRKKSKLPKKQKEKRLLEKKRRSKKLKERKIIE